MTLKSSGSSKKNKKQHKLDINKINFSALNDSSNNDGDTSENLPNTQESKDDIAMPVRAQVGRSSLLL